ncbi:hypothetical protein [Lentilitoribacter sp. Alg239-R112]|uniref:hypothetical protein n=1 Tax=Lentilitoribacter sp. Alg239-R112 TaxID=2305987 RepID=UPI0013A6C834|nr:hypothetical protein [Lentilitoribacter sp. Alg239-R112]
MSKLKTIVRHWRLLLPTRLVLLVSILSANVGNSLKSIAIYLILFVVPIVIGIAAGAAAHISNQQFQVEQALDSRGIHITVNVIHAHTWIYGEPPLSPETADRRFDICYLDIQYEVPGSQEVYSAILHPFGDPNNWTRASSSGPSYRDAPKHCASFESGGTAAAKVLPEDHNVVMLDFTKRSSDDRVPTLFILSIVLITLPLGTLFIGLIQYLRSSRI